MRALLSRTPMLRTAEMCSRPGAVAFAAAPAARFSTAPVTAFTPKLSAPLLDSLSSPLKPKDAFSTLPRLSFSTSAPAPASAQKKAEQAAAKDYVFDFEQMSQETLLMLSSNECEGHYEACSELVTRNIMQVDGVSHEEASVTFAKVDEAAKSGLSMWRMPYTIGMYTFFASAIISVPLVFHEETVMWFNEAFVTFEPPGEGEMDTWLEVGAYSWSWMEPPLGQLSFMILAVQLGAMNMRNLGMKPYGTFYRNYQARNLVKDFPAYNKRILTQFSNACI